MKGIINVQWYDCVNLAILSHFLVLLHCIEESPGPDWTRVSACPLNCCSDESDECLDSNTFAWLSDILWHCFLNKHIPTWLAYWENGFLSGRHQASEHRVGALLAGALWAIGVLSDCNFSPKLTLLRSSAEVFQVGGAAANGRLSKIYLWVTFTENIAINAHVFT